MDGSASGMQAQVISDPAGIGEVEDAWRELAERRSNAFVTPEWVRAWWQHMGSETSELRIVAVRRGDGSLAGVMPLALDKARPRALRFAGAILGDRFHPAADPDEEPAVAAAALGALEADGGAPRMLMLEQVEPGRPWITELREASSRRLSSTEQRQTTLPYALLEGLEWDEYLAQRTKNVRYEFRRRRHRLVADHGMAARTATEETLEADLDALFRLHEMRWTGRGESSLADPRKQAALREFSALALRRGWLRLHILEIEEAEVAAMLCWRVGDVYAYYNSGFDPAWSKMSVGTVVMGIAIREAVHEGAKEFDMLAGSETYKRKFADESRPASTLVLTPALSPLSLVVAGEARARALGRRFLNRPGLDRVARALRSILPTSRA
jgi:CelD/BcsL family acetyltransferase involved in cellulose biosynthesis